MRRSTNLNLYLPDNSDYRDVSQLSYNFETIDDEVGMLGDYTAPVRINYGSNSYVEYWRSGQIGCLYVHYNVTDGSINSWASITLATLPEGFRPVQVVQVRGLMDRAADEGTWASITSGGTVQIGTKYNTFAASGGMLNAYITYPIRY